MVLAPTDFGENGNGVAPVFAQGLSEFRIVGAQEGLVSSSKPMVEGTVGDPWPGAP